MATNADKANLSASSEDGWRDVPREPTKGHFEFGRRLYRNQLRGNLGESVCALLSDEAMKFGKPLRFFSFLIVTARVPLPRQLKTTRSLAGVFRGRLDVKMLAATFRAPFYLGFLPFPKATSGSRERLYFL